MASSRFFRSADISGFTEEYFKYLEKYLTGQTKLKIIDALAHNRISSDFLNNIAQFVFFSELITRFSDELQTPTTIQMGRYSFILSRSLNRSWFWRKPNSMSTNIQYPLIHMGALKFRLSYTTFYRNNVEDDIQHSIMSDLNLGWFNEVSFYLFVDRLSNFGPRSFYLPSSIIFGIDHIKYKVVQATRYMQATQAALLEVIPDIDERFSILYE